MLRSMYSGVSGLRGHQTMMDVVGNNIANVNTTGFKSSSTVFQDVLSQTVQGAGAPGVELGGTNPAQVGLGSRVGAITQNFGQGAVQVTNRAEDLAIEGDGFFVVQLGAETLYTRAGNLSFDQTGTLVTPGGGRVLGVDGAPVVRPETNAAGEGLLSYTISPDGTLVGVFASGNEDLAQIALVTFNNPGGLEKTGNSLYRATVNSGAPELGAPGEDGYGTLASGMLEMSNVDLAQEFTNLIVAQRGFQANSRTITTSDEMLQELVNLKR